MTVPKRIVEIEEAVKAQEQAQDELWRRMDRDYSRWRLDSHLPIPEEGITQATVYTPVVRERVPGGVPPEAFPTGLCNDCGRPVDDHHWPVMVRDARWVYGMPQCQGRLEPLAW